MHFALLFKQMSTSRYSPTQQTTSWVGNNVQFWGLGWGQLDGIYELLPPSPTILQHVERDRYMLTSVNLTSSTTLGSTL